MKTPTTSAVPTKEDPFLLRMCKVLELTPRELAKRLRVPYKDVAALIAPRPLLADTFDEPIWLKVSALIDERIGLLMAARSQMQMALQHDRTKRAVRLAAMEQREKKLSPRQKRMM